MATQDRPPDDGTGMTLQEWLDTILTAKPPTTVISYQFPTEDHRAAYLQSIRKRSRAEVSALLRHFLVPAGTLGIDRANLALLVHQLKGGSRSELREYDRRLILAAKTKGKVHPWEGMTWVLDLLPHHPRKAMDVIDAYFTAHCGSLPDGRLIGLPDAMAVIRAKYIIQGPPAASATLDALTPRQFEALICILYVHMGYEARLTKARADGGRDVEAYRKAKGCRETVFIECKHYARKVKVELVRQLLGVLSDGKIGKGVLVTTNSFTRGARSLERRNPRLELLDRQSLIELMNEHLGADWPIHIDREIAEHLAAD